MSGVGDGNATPSAKGEEIAMGGGGLSCTLAQETNAPGSVRSVEERQKFSRGKEWYLARKHGKREHGENGGQ